MKYKDDMTAEELRALLNALPAELSFVDADGTIRYFNEGRKVFARPASALGRPVYACHKPGSAPAVRAMLDELSSGRRDRADEWLERDGRVWLNSYIAVRGEDGAYLGTLELIRDMEDARAHFAAGNGENGKE